MSYQSLRELIGIHIDTERETAQALQARIKQIASDLEKRHTTILAELTASHASTKAALDELSKIIAEKSADLIGEEKIVPLRGKAA
jgi:UDP:flavonoid glycosyltransferase YjiC (YdhE family)